MISNLMDHWSNFQVDIMESGPFEPIKKSLGELLAKLNAMAANGAM